MHSKEVLLIWNPVIQFWKLGFVAFRETPIDFPFLTQALVEASDRSLKIFGIRQDLHGRYST
jgi:hypothetical protein